MKNQISLIISLALILFVNFNLSTVKITGKVTSNDDQKALSGVNVLIKGINKNVITDSNGFYEILVPNHEAILVFSLIGYVTQEIKASKNKIDVTMYPDLQNLNESVVIGYGKKDRKDFTSRPVMAEMSMQDAAYEYEGPVHNTEEYATIHENIFHKVMQKPLSTFSIDVDNASYSNLRRYIHHGQMPPVDAVRIEEMINYFDYEYDYPSGNQPFSINTELSYCPWNPDHQLVHIGLQGKQIAAENLPPSNLVFLLDVSGSMNSPEKLPLLKSAFRMLVNQLDTKDKIAIVVYAGAAGTVLESTPGSEKTRILAALDKLQAGGSTAGGAGIRLAYEIATKNYIEGGNNRIILATDGDFNIGESSTAAMERLITEKKESGVYLTVLGFGMGNYKDNRMETLADKGNGNYAYIDNISEAKKVLVNQLAGTLYTIAKDVKIQIEFNPAKVKGYRLIGYVNRKLNDEDFNDDKKDAGELGAGHTVTALYEIIPASINKSPYLKDVDELKYQQKTVVKNAESNDLLSLKLRYKDPDGSTSKLIAKTLSDRTVTLEKTSDNFRYSAAVAAFGMLLRDSEYINNFTYAATHQLAQGAIGEDKEGYRREFVKMVESCQLIARK